jgi:hypothetical protein
MVSLGETEDGTKMDWISSVVSIHGSTRTAKIATIRILREIYRRKIQEARRTFSSQDVRQKDVERREKLLCQELYERLTLIQSFD